MLGWPYEPGGNGPYGIDCVHHTVRILQALGASVTAADMDWRAAVPEEDLPRESLEEKGLGCWLSPNGEPEEKWLKVGDSIFDAKCVGDVIVSAPRPEWLHVSTLIEPPHIIATVDHDRGGCLLRSYIMHNVRGIYRWHELV